MYSRFILEESISIAIKSILESIIFTAINSINLNNTSSNNRSKNRTHIIKEAKDKLFLYFDTYSFNQNSKLPRLNSRRHKELDIIISNYRLNRSQVSRQFIS